MSKSVRHIARYDEVPGGFDDFSALGLFDGIFICHFCEERRAHYEELKKAGEKVFALTNEQSAIITGQGVEFC